ncbi:restriction endonuclease subunit S [Vibrio parahaemolyticus]|uniref:restriction endonuclease subunit S n=1 Tax=Vibrio parahaemolyticus TaxID=670 RepID=UPI00215D36ED|nr:restriction endonuclease subunit S [Vibrio parahaemolyticus]MCR9736102.1 restriction endonuclease subunit S [Vibrio parahaemolyticus]
MSCNWPLSSLGDFVSLFTGFPFKSNQFSDVEGTKLLRGDNVAQGTLRWENVKRWTDENVVDKHKNYLLRENDVILAMDRPWIEAGLKFSQIESRDLPCYLVQRVACLRANDPDDQDFLKFIIGSRAFTEYVKLVQTGTAVPHISGKQILAFEFRLPPKDVRLSVGKILSDIDKKVSINTQTNQTLEQMAQAIFKSWFVDFDPVKAKMNGEQPEGMDAATASLFPEKLVGSELGLIPEGWKVSSLSELIKLTGGGTPKRSEETYWNGDIPWFSVKDVPSGSNVFVVDTDEKITELGLNKSSTKLLPKGTTIITARGTVGKLALVGTDMCMNQSCYGIRGKEVGDYYNYFNLKEAVSTLQRNTHGAVFDTITTKTFDTYSMAFSGAELANKFDVLVAPLLQKIEANVRQNIELATLRDILLPKLISGEIEL